ncbi:hypothetical protein ACQKMD_21805 [Viridibacillus sp. NPDC096237]|uniref:hypothetical protein n=1 Tax=Viridibacillus sp. NPDC096237 TaxID=3390721 RepID=UPI003CFE9E5A
MKKYYVEVTFKNGEKMNFETDTDIREVKPLPIPDAEFIHVPEGYGYNRVLVQSLVVCERSTMVP